MNCSWVGSFSESDKKEINKLRRDQVESIKTQNAEYYSQLVSKDIILLLTSFEIIQGKKKFFKIQSEFLSDMKVFAMKQEPIRIERIGDIIIETGNQYFRGRKNGSKIDGFESKRKYNHILKKVDGVWKFHVLMSNDR